MMRMVFHSDVYIHPSTLFQKMRSESPTIPNRNVQTKCQLHFPMSPNKSPGTCSPQGRLSSSRWKIRKEVYARMRLVGDGKYLFTFSHLAPKSLKWSPTCRSSIWNPTVQEFPTNIFQSRLLNKNNRAQNTANNLGDLGKILGLLCSSRFFWGF